MKKNILITGKTSRFFKFLNLSKYKRDFNFLIPDKERFDILNFNQMLKYAKIKKLDYVIHMAGLSSPMEVHDKNINSSIDLNIIGTANIAKICNLLKIKLIFFSTNYVYPGTKGNYKEIDYLKPFNNYGWSKLGAESSVHMLEKFLILRISMTDFPFSYKAAIKGAYSSLIFNKKLATIIINLIDEIGVLNIGGKRREIYEFAKIFSNKKIKSINVKSLIKYPKDTSLNISKFKEILKKKKIHKKLIL